MREAGAGEDESVGADAHLDAGNEFRLTYRIAIDIGAVGAAQIRNNVVTLAGTRDAGVVQRDLRMRQRDGVIFAPANGDRRRRLCERDSLTFSVARVR